MIDYKVEDGKIISIDGYEVGGGGYKIKKLTNSQMTTISKVTTQEFGKKMAD